MAAASLAGLAYVATRDTPFGRSVGTALSALSGQARYWRSAWPGVRYRLTGRHPEFNVSDDLLADRVRSALGPLERRLDVPRVHVMVEHAVVLLHGDVPTMKEADALERAACRVAGVQGLESYLHIGLLASDTRPSEGGQPTAAYGSLLAAARRAGVAQGQERRAARVVLATLLERVPEDERAQVLDHLPRDARRLAEFARRRGMTDIHRPVELEDALVRNHAAEAAIAGDVVRSVLAALHELVTDEVADVSAVLPAPLRSLWDEAATP